jgi:hypothetical protein
MADKEIVERTDGFTVSVEITRGSGVRDADELYAKGHAETTEEAEAVADELAEILDEMAGDVRAIQPEADDD